MSHNRDMSIPYTEQEIADVVQMCKKFATFDDDSIGTGDFGIFSEALRYNRTAEQIQAYVDYFDKHMGGRLSLKGVEDIMRVHHKPSLHAGWYARICDTDNDGLISKDEFERIYCLMAVQWPNTAGKSYDDFVREADADNSGAVDVHEFVNWLEASCNKTTNI